MVNVLSRLWRDSFSVTEYRPHVKSDGSTGFEGVVITDNQPCKLSFSTLAATEQNDDYANIVQTTKLFCDPALIINAGSKITVTHRGRTTDYTRSGEPAVYPNHQEIVLAPYKRRA
jgi:hypothetical protein